ncbi:tetratricopeptide repeat-containing sensor histidine kinase [Marivirga arenosa]|uniref:histidine kinase n=1 Tax=Marivirga arenosa TaxID=3059076 RepID=A0AA52EWE2_9BACT|nr:tetratricopeptide repeat protein [Marivirga sp. BKB1-2]WNB17900.1 tetratricopeptide repeat protein [Marivirga sp. BKB1-2]
MKKLTLSILLWFFLCSFSLAFQIPDSVEVELNQVVGVENKINFLLEYADQALKINNGLHYQLANEAKRLALTTNDENLIAKAEKQIGLNIQSQNLLDSARNHFLLMIDKYGEALEDKILAGLYIEIGATYYYEANDKMAIEYWKRANRIIEKLNDTKLLAKLSNNIGATYGYLGDYKNAIYYLKNAIKYKQQLGDSASLASSYHNLGIYTSELASYDSARYYFYKSLEIKKKYNDKKGLAKTYNSLAVLFSDEEKYDSALFYNSKVLALDLEIGDSIAYSIDIGNRAGYYLKTSRFKEGIQTATKSIQLLKDVKAKSDMYKVIAQLYEGAGQYKKATENWANYAELNDSIISAERAQSLQELQVQFDTELKESEIAKLESENKIQRLQQQKDRQSKIMLIAILSAVAIIAILLFRSFKKENSAKKLLDQQNKELKELNFTKDRLFSIIGHDLKSPLSSFHTITKSLTENWDKLEKEQLKSFIESLRDSSKEVHEMMDNLLRWALSQTGQLNYKPQLLEPNVVVDDAIKQLEVAIQANGLILNRKYNSSASIQADQDYLKIILRNLLSNAIKFSSMGKSIDLIIDENERYSTISIKDYGVGMSESEVALILSENGSVHDIKNSDKKGTGLGVTLSKELLQKMGAKMEIESEQNSGTTFKLLFPKAA